MPVAWTTENDRRLLLLVLELSKVNNADIATLWRDKYEGEGDQPTARAISERLYKLKNTTGSGKATGFATSTPRKSASTPSKVNKTKARTPTSNSKKRKIQSSDEEPSMSESKSDSEEEQKYKVDRTPRRSISRASKAAQSYAESDGEAGPAPRENDGHKVNGTARVNGFGGEDDAGDGSDSDFGTFM